MTATPDPEVFIAAGLVERAITLLETAFRDPREPVSRANVADAIANAAGRTNTAGITGGQLLGRGSPDPEILRLVSEAWQLLEQGRLICPALDPSTRGGDWWVLTHAGEAVRNSGDLDGQLRLALQGQI